MLKVSLLLILINFNLICISGVNGDTSQFFRRDYTLYSEVGAFYKVQKTPKSWNDARKACILEGSTLAVPETAAEAEVYSKLIDDNLDDYRRLVFVGIHAFARGLFTTLDDTPIDEIYHGWAPGEPNDMDDNEYCVAIDRRGKLRDVPCLNKYPFICEKARDTVKWNNDCQIADLDYGRINGMANCYKLHLTPKNWTEAYATCTGESSSLAILNSEAESTALKQLYETKSDAKINSGNVDILLGFHDKFREGQFITIKGMSLVEAGFNSWSSGQPDHPTTETCGSMFPSGLLNDVNCALPSPFICEHENDLAIMPRRRI
uniref:Immulectin 4 n=1 Tax=Hepialus xiaojinensis TaxID=1589740 RepID=A0A219YXG7_9NEOP|nr:immulectin 4 [Hepialus xiaojinensis]